MLALLEAEATVIAQGADRTADVFGQRGLRGILNQRDPAVAGDPSQGLHVARLAKEMNGDGGPRAGRDPARDILRIQAIRVRTDVRENRQRILRQNRDDRTEIRDRRNDDLVAGFGVQGADGQVDGGRTRGGGHHSPGRYPVQFGEGGLQGIHVRSADTPEVA